MAKYRDILFSLDFMETVRPDLVFSDATKIRLDPADHLLKLKADANGAFPTDANLSIKTQEFWPRTNKAWRGFFAIVSTPTGTSIGFKLNNGTDDYYWTGSVWAVAGASDWNTEAEIAANIATFDVGKLHVVVNLVTTDATATPALQYILVGYYAQIVFLEQWIYRTLVPLLREGCRPYAHWAIPIGSITSTIDLNNYRLDTPFNVVGIDTVYNHTDDPDHYTDIFSSYDTGTKIITLTTPIAAGKVAWINFTYEPIVAVLTSTDYHELRKVPALTLEDLRLTAAHEGGWTNALIDKGAGTGVVYESPRQCRLEGDIVIHAPRGLDEMALAEEVLAFLSDNQTVTIRGTGEKADWMLKDPYARSSNAERNDLRTATIGFKLWPLLMWIRPARSAGVYAVTGMRLTGDVDVVI